MTDERSAPFAPHALPPLHLVTDDRVLAASDFLARAEAVLRDAGSYVALHLRGPRTAGGALYRLAEPLRRISRESGSLLLLNDRIDVALAVGADGAQLGARSLDAAHARRLLGPERLLGLSVHDPAEVAAALAGSPSFLLIGTLYASASHPSRAGAGPALLHAFARFGTPRIAIGGITPERVPAVRAAGAAGVAVLGGVWGTPDPVRAARAYLDCWEGVDE